MKEKKVREGMRVGKNSWVSMSNDGRMNPPLPLRCKAISRYSPAGDVKQAPSTGHAVSAAET